jgi:hypothetical protein
VVKARTWLALVLISFGTVAATVSCGSDEATGGGGGLITAGSAGSGAGGTGGSGAVGRGGTGSSTGGATSASTSLLGATCTAPADCGTGLTCLLANDATLTEGPANGLCTMACTDSTTCDAASPGAACVDIGGGHGYCYESCTQGDPGTDITVKCHGRPDEACESYGMGTTFLCTPLCRADMDCGTGLFCDPTEDPSTNRNSGLCAKTKPKGDPPGTPCDPNATTSTCLGICLTTAAVGTAPAKSVCAELCSGVTECLYTGVKPGGFCVGQLDGGTDFSILDLGFCEPACNCDKDCNIPGDLCQAWTADAATIQADLGTDGFCYPNATGSTELTCGEGGAPSTGPAATAGAGGSND